MSRLWALLLLSCGNGGEARAVGEGSTAPPAAPASVAAAPTPADAAPAHATPSPKLTAARCDEPCLFLLDTPLAQIPTEYRKVCGKDTAELGFEDCKQLDYARNCMYAAHGVTYKARRWKTVFAAKAWYEPRADADPKHLAMTDVEHANAHELYMRGKACKRGLHVSGADYERIKKWFGTLPRAPRVPKLAYFWEDMGGSPTPDEPVTTSDLVSSLLIADPDLRARVLGGHAHTEYKDATKLFEEHPFLRTRLPGVDPSKLRAIVIDDELGSGSENQVDWSNSVWIELLYDDHDELRAVLATHAALES